MQHILEVLLQGRGLFERAFFLVDLERGNACGGGDSMTGVSIAMEYLDHVLRTIHVRIVDLVAHEYGAHRDDAVGKALGCRDDVRCHIESLRAECMSDAAECGDHLIEDQQYSVFVTDLAQTLEVARRRRYHAGRSRYRLDDDGRDIAAIMQSAQPLEVFCELDAVLGQSARERVALYIQCVPEVVDTGNHCRTEYLAIRHDPANRHATKVDAVVALLTTDQPRAIAFAARAMIAQRNLQGSVHRL